eukprot:gene33924-43827_t
MPISLLADSAAYHARRMETFMAATTRPTTANTKTVPNSSAMLSVGYGTGSFKLGGPLVDLDLTTC